MTLNKAAIFMASQILSTTFLWHDLYLHSVSQNTKNNLYVGVLIILWPFLFPASWFAVTTERTFLG
jgi:hypothetical protein